MPVVRLLSGLLIIVAVGTACGGARAADAQDYSVAERLIFMSPQLQALHLPSTLHYSFHKSGSLEPGFDDGVELVVEPRADGKCCAARSEFLSGARRLQMPELESAEGNPVVMYFLERDVREMQRLTKGSQNYFRKRLRMAIYESAAVRETTLNYRGREIRGKEITIAPFRDDPNRQRFEKFAPKQYRFLLSDDVPGGVFGLQSSLRAEADGAAPLLVEELFLDGASVAAAKSKP